MSNATGTHDAAATIRALRRQARETITRLLAFLDATQPDADLEPDDFDEKDDHHGDDADDPRGEGDYADNEPSLGWTVDGALGAATDGRNDECEAGCPPATRVSKKPTFDRLDNMSIEPTLTGRPRLRRGKPKNPPGICNVGQVLASWRVD